MDCHGLIHGAQITCISNVIFDLMSVRRAMLSESLFGAVGFISFIMVPGLGGVPSTRHATTRTFTYFYYLVITVSQQPAA